MTASLRKTRIVEIVVANLRLIRAGRSLRLALRGGVEQREDGSWTGIKEWMVFIGRRNIASPCLTLLGMAMEAAGPKGPDSGAGIMAAIILWSLIFFIPNAGLTIGSISRAVGNEAFDHQRSPGRMYRPPLAFGALLCAVTVFPPEARAKIACTFLFVARTS